MKFYQRAYSAILSVLLFCFFGFAFFFFGFALIFPSPSFALGKIEAAELSKLVHWLPSFACQDHKALKTCVLWTTEICEVQLEKSLESCFKLNSKKIQSHGPKLAEWKEKIINCAERDALLKVRSQIIPSQICKNKGVAAL